MSGTGSGLLISLRFFISFSFFLFFFFFDYPFCLFQPLITIIITSANKGSSAIPNHFT